MAAGDVNFTITAVKADRWPTATISVIVSTHGEAIAQFGGEPYIAAVAAQQPSVKSLSTIPDRFVHCENNYVTMSLNDDRPGRE
jgi:hypothetical protein